MSGKEIYQYSKVPMTLLQGRLPKSWSNTSNQFFSLSTTSSIMPVFIMFIGFIVMEFCFVTVFIHHVTHKSTPPNAVQPAN